MHGAQRRGSLVGIVAFLSTASCAKGGAATHSPAVVSPAVASPAVAGPAEAKVADAPAPIAESRAIEAVTWSRDGMWDHANLAQPVGTTDANAIRIRDVWLDVLRTARLFERKAGNFTQVWRATGATLGGWTVWKVFSSDDSRVPIDGPSVQLASAFVFAKGSEVRFYDHEPESSSPNGYDRRFRSVRLQDVDTVKAMWQWNRSLDASRGTSDALWKRYEAMRAKRNVDITPGIREQVLSTAGDAYRTLAGLAMIFMPHGGLPLRWLAAGPVDAKAWRAVGDGDPAHPPPPLTLVDPASSFGASRFTGKGDVDAGGEALVRLEWTISPTDFVVQTTVLALATQRPFGP
jgi:hypothetical protein